MEQKSFKIPPIIMFTVSDEKINQFCKKNN